MERIPSLRNVTGALLLALAAGAAPPAYAQRAEAPVFAPRPMPAWPAAAPSSIAPSRAVCPLLDSSAIHATHWLEGGLIGAAIVGGGLAFLAGSLYDPDSGSRASRGQVVVSAALLGGFSGFVIGALIGGASPKSAGP